MTSKDDEQAMDGQLSEISELSLALSDAADGRATPEQLRALSAAWAERPELQAEWQAMHLIGDSLRSAELASHAQAPEALLAGLRERLAAEPSPARVPRWHDWTKPLAVAASFIGLAVMVLPSLQRGAGSDAVALTQPAQQLPMATGTTLVGGAPSFAQSVVAVPPVASPVLLRDASHEMSSAGAAPLDIAVPPASAAVTSALPRR